MTIITAIVALPLFLVNVVVSGGQEYMVSKWDTAHPVTVQTTAQMGCRATTSESSAPGIAQSIQDAIDAPGAEVVWTSSDGNSHTAATYDAFGGVVTFSAWEPGAGAVKEQCSIKLSGDEPKELQEYIRKAAVS